MPTLTCYHLDPESGFHLGQRGVGQEETGVFIPADTLFSALLTAWAEFGRSPETLARPFLAANGQAQGGTPFLLTSAFPRAGRVCFYPALPLSRLNISPAKFEDRLKELKAIQFISEGVFRRAVAGELLDDWLPRPNKAQSGDKGLYLQGQALWLTAEEVDRLPDSLRLKDKGRTRPGYALRHLKVWETHKVPRVTVDRLTNCSAIYHTGRLEFGPGCGFWFGLAWQQPDRPAGDHSMRQAFTLALNSLADVGMGGERSAGYGHFTWREDGSLTFPDPEPDQPFVTLSRYHPRPAELPQVLRGQTVAYRLVSVAGWLQSPQSKAQRRRRLWLVAEGSIVRAVGRGPWGDVTDVRPIYEETVFPHPVYRYGLACPVAFGGAL